MKLKNYFLYIISALLVVGCSSDAPEKLTEKLLPKPNPHGYSQLKLNEKFLSNNGYMVVEDVSYRQDGTLDISFKLVNKLTELGFEQGIIEPNGVKRKQETGSLRIYKQNYSVVAGKHVRQKYDASGYITREDSFNIADIQGQTAKFSDLPQSGSVTYNGKAFTGNTEGLLSYTIDFANKKGSGNIRGLDSAHNVTLNSASINGINDIAKINGNASINGTNVGTYEAGLFGSKAEEIAGKVHLNTSEHEIGFAGKK